MGNLILLLTIATTLILLALRSWINTPIDWILLVLMIFLGAKLIPDKYLTESATIVNTYWKNKVDYGSWFK